MQVEYERISARKRKRDHALNTVCDRMGSMQLSDGRQGGRTDEARPAYIRSKSILKKTATRVRFARSRTSADFVMFDETNIKEVQTCLHPCDEGGHGSDVDMDRSTPRSVMLLQDGNNSDDQSADAHSPSNDVAPVPTRARVYQDPHVFGSSLDDVSMSCESSSRAKRGRIRQHEIEEGMKFRDMLAQLMSNKDDSGDDRKGSTQSVENHSFTLALGTGLPASMSPALSSESPVTEERECTFRLASSPVTEAPRGKEGKDVPSFCGFDIHRGASDLKDSRKSALRGDAPKAVKAAVGFNFDAPPAEAGIPPLGRISTPPPPQPKGGP
eukprot:TRINITY_DN6582_c0_g1_i3.p1 TRINITY_DN6582_c0_g1~~TRINITY_DN6582_c0_g1_i3.p1  ORF type:complete len:327 (+),score=73.62 TRINITY_DN6582_c0_g1_i3:105-1085(+)